MYCPNYHKSVLNISATLSDYLGVKNDIPKLENLKRYLKKDKKNIVFIILDGLGLENVKELTDKNNFFEKHTVDYVTSVLPSTTTNSTTSMIACSYPSEHLYVGWAIWFKEYKKVVQLFKNKDDYTGEFVTDVFKILPYENYFNKEKTDRKIYTVMPSYAGHCVSENNVICDIPEDTVTTIHKVLKEPERKFVYCYCHSPDYLMHRNGVTSKEVKDFFEKMQIDLENLQKAEKDSLIIITADHGHIDISEHIKIYEDKEIMELQERPLSLERRFVSFKIKPDKKKEFTEIFNRKYGKDFELFTSDALIKKGIFGINKNRDKLKEFLGDFIAIGTDTNKGFLFSPKHNVYKGHHTGGTKAEMEVPLIVIES